MIALLLICSVFSGCSGRKKGAPPVFTSDNKVILTLGGYNVTSDFYDYLWMNTKYYYDNGDDSFWEDNDVKLISDYVLNSLYDTYAMFTLADEYDITLDDEDNEYIDSYIESSKEGYSDKDYKKSLAESYMDEELYRFILEVQRLEYKVYEHITSEGTGVIKVDDDTLNKALETEFVRATHILFTFKNDDEAKTKLEKAESVLERLKNGEDFEELKEKFSEDTALKGNTNGYYFTHGEFKNEFEYTAFKLKEGEISDVVLSDVGLHIIKRLPLEENYVNDHYEQLRKQYITSLYYDLIETTAKGLTVEYREGYPYTQPDISK